MGYLSRLLSALTLVAVFVSASTELRRKRQLFREQVLPQSGGKIPEEAFRTDRLALNRLNKEGIAIPDGVLLETRHRESHWPSHRVDPDIQASIIWLVQRPDGRYAPPEGRYPFNNLVESTYVIRPPINVHGYGGLPPRKPVQVTLQLPAKPFFAEDDETPNNVDNFDLLNTISQDFPGTRLWTGFGPLFHEHTNRILRHSGGKQVNAKPGGSSSPNQLVRQAGISQDKQLLKANAQNSNVISLRTTPAAIRVVQQSNVNGQQAANNNYVHNSTAGITLLQKTIPSDRSGEANTQGSPRPSNIQDILNGITTTQASNSGVTAASSNPQSNVGMVRTPSNDGTRTFQMVNGVLTPVTAPSNVGNRPARPPSRNVQPLRPGPVHVLKTHLTAPPAGYPSLERIPKTSFVCRKSTGQMESDPQTNCQVFHLCHHDGRKESFLCPVGSRYDSKANLCSPWTSVPCPANT